MYELLLCLSKEKNMCRLKMLIKRGRFVEYGVFGKETSVDWTIIAPFELQN